MTRTHIAGLAALTLTAAMLPAQAQDLTRAQGEQLVARYVEIKNGKDASRIPDVFKEDYQERSGRNPSGAAALAANWKAQFAAIPDLRADVQDIVVSGDRVVARIQYSGTHTTPLLAGIAPTGRKFSFATIDIWRVEGGRFAEHWDVVDFAGLQRQLSAPAAQ